MLGLSHLLLPASSVYVEPSDQISLSSADEASLLDRLEFLKGGNTPGYEAEKQLIEALFAAGGSLSALDAAGLLAFRNGFTAGSDEQLLQDWQVAFASAWWRIKAAQAKQHPYFGPFAHNYQPQAGVITDCDVHVSPSVISAAVKDFQHFAYLHSVH